MRPDVIDTVRSTTAATPPTGEEIALVETGPNTGIFTGSNADHRRCNPVVDAPIPANDPFTIRNAAAQAVEQRTDDESTTADTGGIRNRFTRSSERSLAVAKINLAMEIALRRAANSLAVSSVRLRTGVETIQEGRDARSSRAAAAIFFRTHAAVGRHGRQPEVDGRIPPMRHASWTWD